MTGICGILQTFLSSSIVHKIYYVVCVPSLTSPIQVRFKLLRNYIVFVYIDELKL